MQFPDEGNELHRVRDKAWEAEAFFLLSGRRNAIVDVALDVLPVEGDRADLHPGLCVTLVAHDFRHRVLVIDVFRVTFEVVFLNVPVWLPAKAIFVLVRESRDILVVDVVLANGAVVIAILGAGVACLLEDGMNGHRRHLRREGCGD